MTDHEHSPEDPLPAMLAALDQASAMAPAIAGVARAYMDAFTDRAFSESQALYLTVSQILQNPGTAPRG